MAVSAEHAKLRRRLNANTPLGTPHGRQDSLTRQKILKTLADLGLTLAPANVTRREQQDPWIYLIYRGHTLISRVEQIVHQIPDLTLLATTPMHVTVQISPVWQQQILDQCKQLGDDSMPKPTKPKHITAPLNHPETSPDNGLKPIATPNENHSHDTPPPRFAERGSGGGEKPRTPSDFTPGQKITAGTETILDGDSRPVSVNTPGHVTRTSAVFVFAIFDTHPGEELACYATELIPVAEPPAVPKSSPVETSSSDNGLQPIEPNAATDDTPSLRSGEGAGGEVNFHLLQSVVANHDINTPDGIKNIYHGDDGIITNLDPLTVKFTVLNLGDGRQIEVAVQPNDIRPYGKQFTLPDFDLDALHCQQMKEAHKARIDQPAPAQATIRVLRLKKEQAGFSPLPVPPATTVEIARLEHKELSRPENIRIANAELAAYLADGWEIIPALTWDNGGSRVITLRRECPPPPLTMNEAADQLFAANHLTPGSDPFADDYGDQRTQQESDFDEYETLRETYPDLPPYHETLPEPANGTSPLSVHGEGLDAVRAAYCRGQQKPDDPDRLREIYYARRRLFGTRRAGQMTYGPTARAQRAAAATARATDEFPVISILAPPASQPLSDLIATLPFAQAILEHGLEEVTSALDAQAIQAGLAAAAAVQQHYPPARPSFLLGDSTDE